MILQKRAEPLMMVFSDRLSDLSLVIPIIELFLDILSTESQYLLYMFTVDKGKIRADTDLTVIEESSTDKFSHCVIYICVLINNERILAS